MPLGDVPDYIFVAAKGTRPEEGSQHFADIYDIDGGKTLLQRCISGILSHYVSDASQPLHCSYLHHGVPPMKKVNGRGYPPRHDSEEYELFKKTREAKIHAIFDETILEVDPATTLRALDTQLGRASKNKVKIESGHDAAVQTVRLMFNSQQRLAPMDIIKADKPELGPKARAKELWNHQSIRDATISGLVDSTRILAATWKAAWQVGGGDGIAKSKLVGLKEADLDKLCRRDRSFLPSLSLAAMVKSGKFEP